MARFFESKVEFLGYQQEVIVIDFGLFGLFVHGLQEGGLYLLIFRVLGHYGITLLSEIQTSLFVIKYNYY
jgi:hypothetical protein